MRDECATGKLNAKFPTQTGCFYLVEGRLVAAELGALTGLSAVNVVLWMQSATFSFEPNLTAARHDLDIAKAELLLDRLLSIENTSEALQHVATVSETRGEIALPQQTHNPVPFLNDASEANAARSISEPRSRFMVSFRRHRKLATRASLTVVLAAGITIVIANINRSHEAPITTPTRTQPQIAQPEKSRADVDYKPESKSKISTTSSLVGDFGFSTGPSESTITTERQKKVNESVPVREPQATASPPVVAVSKPAATPAEKEYVEIAVKLQIEDGRVTEAHVGNRQAGAEAFEASALQLARQKRYPSGTSTSETVVFRIARQPGRKEP
ncbi:MAG: hypothetical protein C5B55_06495 [Blastocatellia bacterium]|nr:MAG: hypothetical protein C5B55_06495 [Blastocatellia bacterium]